MTTAPRRALAPRSFARAAALALTMAAGGALPLAVIAPARPAPAQQPGGLWTGERGITETVAQIMRRPTGPIPMPVEADEHDEYPNRAGLPQDPGSPFVSQWPPAPAGFHSLPVPVYPRVGNPDLDNPQTISLNFQGIGSGESGWFPPDTQMAVGPTQLVAVSNGRIKVFTKT